MSNTYLEGKEVFTNMKKLFKQLLANEEQFRKVYEANGEVTLTLDDEEDFTFVIEETGDEISLGDYDYSVGDDTPTELTFSRIFEYEEDSAYLYMGGVIADEDREYDGYKY